jgi:hypothetical protein
MIRGTEGQPLFQEEKGCPHEMEIFFAGIAGQVAVCTSAVAKVVKSSSAEREEPDR